MSDNKRNSSRVGLVIEIKMTCDDKSEHILSSQNISDTGVFLEHNEKHLELPIGTHVILQVCSQIGDGTPPPVNAEIVRITKEGMGLQFIL
ncbi:MAG: PilZ domain-containing protein [Gammaproteobacteria bacterium]|nr:PilZ domain-containing protein [Gammaproteobacteria bacterium]MCW8986740.1 PilZ domain-containing protein [Gammaproteobacteria bacterium]MCW9031582.1 PilZ domain-containing protein [Gammaproteobacteria bacterium]